MIKVRGLYLTTTSYPAWALVWCALAFATDISRSSPLTIIQRNLSCCTKPGQQSWPGLRPARVNNQPNHKRDIIPTKYDIESLPVIFSSGRRIWRSNVADAVEVQLNVDAPYGPELVVLFEEPGDAVRRSRIRKQDDGPQLPDEVEFAY